jgi:hypothetical protein
MNGVKRQASWGICSCPYTRIYSQLPNPLGHALKLHKVSSIQPDGEFLVLLLNCPDCRQELLKSIFEQYPPPVSEEVEKEVHEWLTRLTRAVASGTRSSDCEEVNTQWWTNDKRICLQSTAANPLKDKLLKWRGWTPRMLTTLELHTQRSLEVELRKKWVARLLGHIIPHAPNIPYLAKVLGHTDEMQEFKDLLGATRFGTLRTHTLNLEKMLQLVPSLIPWDEKKLISLLNALRTQEVTPQKVQQFWLTMKFLSIRLGLIDPEQLAQIKHKKEAIRDALVTTLILPQRRAVVPSLDVIRALETLSRRPGPDGYLASIARFLVGCSGRLSDAQHTQPSTMQLTAETIEFTAWQTKVMSVVTNRQKPTPLIAPLHSFTGVPWWQTLEKGVKWMLLDKTFRDLDFMLPCPTKDRLGWVPRPASNGQAMRWLRFILAGEPMGSFDLHTLSWPSFRVFMADWAYRTGISRDRRRYIGRWASDSMADTYTREHRSVICSIWNEVVSSKEKLVAGVSVPEDLTTAHYFPEKQNGGPQELAVTPEKSTIKSLSPGGSDNSWNVIEVSKGKQGGTLDPGQPIPADKVAVEQGGPLTPMSVLRGARGSRQTKAHLFRTDGKAVGCGWMPRHGQVQIIAEEDWLHDADCVQCTKCFKFFTWPSTWIASGEPVADPVEESQSEISSASEVDSDLDSEEGGLVPTW